MSEAVSRVNVFARVAPEHKLRLVQALQSRNEIVAMTGDGVNDAPALKQANIGVAMGITGTAASQQAADLVLTDDNFASIGAAVEEGRRVYDNLIKSLAFVLPTNLGLALILLCAVAFFPFNRESGELLLALSPVQLLWINLVATVSLALPLAFEAQEADIMRRPPRRPGEPVLGRFLLIRTAVVATLMTALTVGIFLWEYYGEQALGRSPAHALAKAQTIAVTTIVLFQCFYLANCRSLRSSFISVGLFTNPLFYVGVTLVLLLQVTFIYLPAANALFGSSSLALTDWTKALIVGALIVPAMVLEKRVIRPQVRSSQLDHRSEPVEPCRTPPDHQRKVPMAARDPLLEKPLLPQESIHRLIRPLHPWVAFVIMPLFALANAGVPFGTEDVLSPVALAVILGLAVGKPLGILLLSWLSVKSGFAQLPESVTWRHMIGGGFLAGIGFTMALFIAGLAFTDETLLRPAKVGVLVGSAVSAVDRHGHPRYGRRGADDSAQTAKRLAPLANNTRQSTCGSQDFPNCCSSRCWRPLRRRPPSRSIWVPTGNCSSMTI